MFPVDPRDFISANSGDTTNCLANHVVPTDAPSRGALFSWSLGDPFFKSNVIAFHYGNLTHPSVDPPRIGFLSAVPSNASQLLVDAVKTAQQNGKFESTSQAAPTTTVAGGKPTTLSVSSVAMPSTTGTKSAVQHSNQAQDNSSGSIRSHGLKGVWSSTLLTSSIALLYCWI